MSSNQSPYVALPGKAFWSPSVGNLNPLQISGLWDPKYQINKSDRIATTGSCFAHHISRALKVRGFNWVDSEPAPADLDPSFHTEYNYGVFSFRTGNIYSVALLKQWVMWSLNDQDPSTLEIWGPEKGRYIDPFRPTIVPTGFASRAAVVDARKTTFQAIQKTLGNIDIFVFTLGLTEAWANAETDLIYPMCPGTLAGVFDSDKHKFINYQYPEIRRGLREVFELIKTVNPNIRFLLTVSPVPLTATASSNHVLTATIHSKSVLRAVAGDIASTRKDTDYFPSFEIISAFPFKGMFYEPNMRSVAPEGVDFVMKEFFRCQQATFGSKDSDKVSENLDELDNEVCEDALLDAFADKEIVS